MGTMSEFYTDDIGTSRNYVGIMQEKCREYIVAV